MKIKTENCFRILVIIGISCWSFTRAEIDQTSPEAHELSYEDAVQLALHDNVDLLTLRNQEESFKFQSRQAIAPNEPTFTWMKNDIPGFSLTQTPAQTVYQVNWTLGFPGKALSNSASILHQSEAVAQQARAQEITLMTTLSNSYVTFATNAAFYKFLLDEQKKDGELIKLIEKRFSASQASKVDLLNAEVATQQLAQAILENRNDYDVQLTQFRQIIRRPSDKALFPKIPEKIIIPPVTQSFEDLVPVMLRNNQAIAAASKTVASQTSLETSAMLQALPDLQLTAGVNSWLPGSEPNPGLSRDYTIGVGVVIPIFFPFNELQGIHAARKNRDAAETQYASQQLQAISGLQTAYASLKATLKDLDTSERLVVPAAKASFDLTLLTYGLGKADYLILNESRKAWHDASRDMITKRQNAAQFYNQLTSQMGCDITKTEGPNVCK